jgi:hypothetical protein
MDGNSGLATRISEFIRLVSLEIPAYLRTGDTRGFNDAVSNIRQFTASKYPNQSENVETLIEAVGAMVEALEPFKKQ